LAVAHFRILGNDKYAPYGTSILSRSSYLAPAYFMEDAMMAYRVIRSSERRVFKIDVGAFLRKKLNNICKKL
jgi:hypothetical protein